MAPSPTAPTPPRAAAARRRRRSLMDDNNDDSNDNTFNLTHRSAATTGAGDATPSPPPRLGALGRLATPVARKADSIASQFQREILGSDLASKAQQLHHNAPASTDTGTPTACAKSSLVHRLVD